MRGKGLGFVLMFLTMVSLCPSPFVFGQTAREAIRTVRPGIEPLLRTLEADSRLAPAPLQRERPVQIVLRTDRDGRVQEGTVLPLKGGTLDRDRDRQVRIGRRGQGWLVIVDPSSRAPVWWAPIEDPAGLHQEGPRTATGFSGRVKFRPRGVIAVRAPFVPGGIVVRVRRRPAFETFFPDEALVLGQTLEEGIRLLPERRVP